MLRLGVMVSGGGTNLQAIIDSIESGYLVNCSIVTVVSSRKDAYALVRAEKHGIPSVCIRRKDYDTLEEYDEALVSFKEIQGGPGNGSILSIVGERFINEFPSRIINIHPS